MPCFGFKSERTRKCDLRCGTWELSHGHRVHCSDVEAQQTHHGMLMTDATLCLQRLEWFRSEGFEFKARPCNSITRDDTEVIPSLDSLVSHERSPLLVHASSQQASMEYLLPHYFLLGSQAYLSLRPACALAGT